MYKIQRLHLLGAKGEVMKNILKVSLFSFIFAVSMTSCSGSYNDGGSGACVGGCGPTYSWLTSPNASADAFVDSLNYVDGTLGSYVELYSDETYRTYEPGQEEWFVIWDDYFAEYKAVSLQYIRAIEYYDYVRNTDSLASEFRAIEADDIAAGNLYGDYWGDDYETVDYDEWTDSFWGRHSGYEYEDEDETTDVNLMAAKKAEAQFLMMASAVSYEFKVNLSTAMSLVTLGKKVEAMMSKGELTTEDEIVLSTDLSKLTGVTLSDLQEKSKEEILEKASKSVGTSAANLEQRILPEMFGIEI